MKDDVTIVQCKDVSTIFGLVQKFSDCFTPPITSRVGDLHLYAAKLQQNATLYCLKEGSEIAGCIAFYCNDVAGRTGYLTLLVVDEAFRGKGYGLALMKTMFQVAESCGMKSIRFEVSANNRVAIKLYLKCGFTYEKESQLDKIYMCKTCDETGAFTVD
ncbi:GNAT family N-acetyltransferase [Candidatus Sumerlaeota bacterium]|nr:GNAT family N-acetyltransferase [Candidatus Sumerlaeota bacterium]